MKKTITFIVGALFVLALTGCGQMNENQGTGTATDPPARVPDTLEEQFDQSQADNGSVVGSSIVVSYPTDLPTERISFSTPDRFSISYKIRVAVANTNEALDLLTDFSYDVGNMNFTYADGYTSAEVILTSKFDDLNSTFNNLYSMGIVEEYIVTVYDMARFDENDDIEYWQARWAENNTIAITFIEKA